ncbi:hypothetical protein PV325_006050 [Microctonus aethiopoides]|uniref:Serine palmitoyltransferase 1 n=1 Tax=Microctonus aethiopoides TaxID=144406 RepID=A0AA39FM67_9HYME|nr:hypothetical protein PV325_006050 [Microctonus aethiopoides]KAK0172199.1 hypothetical protein PV328_005546 [Microctonus aethiopoides]
MSTKFISLESMNIIGTISQYHTVVGLLMVFWLIWLFVKRQYNKKRIVIPSDDEIEEKLAAWHPDPLVPEPNEDHPSLKLKLVSKHNGKRITVNDKNCLNLGTHNYLGLSDNKLIEENAVAAIKKYGVGSCGPRGFYGTFDVHLELEESIAKFMNVEEAILYSYGFCTVSSAISAYCKKRDIVFADEKVNFAIQKGLDASRSSVRYFKHNDIKHLECMLEEQAVIDNKNPKKASKIRRFLIIEGIYMNTGLVCPLPELVALCRKYKLRIFIDESISIGTLGDTGRGVTEHFGVPGHEIDMFIGSLEWAFGSIGGFCAGSSFIIEHQRLSGLGYCFSASLPPLLTVAAISAIKMISEDQSLIEKLRENCLNIQSRLGNLKNFELSATPESPVKHLYLKNKYDRLEEQKLLSSISEKCIENNLAVTLPAYLDVERDLPRPSLRLCISSLLDESDIDFVITTLNKYSEDILYQ